MQRSRPRALSRLSLVGLAAFLLLGPLPLRAQESDTPDAPAAAPASSAPGLRPLKRILPVATPAPSPAAPSDAGPAASDAPPETLAPVQPPAATPLSAPAPSRLTPNTPIPPAELEALVDGAVQQAMGERRIAGVTVSVVQNGLVILKKGYGLASLAPARAVDPDRSMFRVGSISKLFTWMLVMKEVERGRMRLDAPVNLYLPEPLQIRDQGYVRQVELRDLMTHSAGFEDKQLGRLYELRASRVRPLNTYLRQEKPRRVRPAGELPEYSNYGAGLAGAAVSQVTGQAYEDLAEAEIIRPLGLTHTTFREPRPADPDLPAPMPASLAPDAAEGLNWTQAGYAAQPYEYVGQLAPAGAASSTAADMARFMTLILAGGALDGQTIYSPQTAQAFRTVILRSGPGIQGWAHGFMQRFLPGGYEAFGHEGATLNFRSNLLTIPALNLGIFVAVNSSSGGDLAQALPSVIVQRFYAPPPAVDAPGSPDLYALRGAYQGDYVDENRRYGGLEQFVALLNDRTRIGVSPDGRLMVAGDAFIPTSTPGQFREVGGVHRIAGFQMAGGVAQRWLTPAGTKSLARVGPIWRLRTMLTVTFLALTAAAATLIGLFTRDRREFRQTPVQGSASAIQTATAILWVVAAAGFGWWGLRASHNNAVAFNEWPGPWVVIASSAALVAALCSLGQVLLLPAVWRGGRRVESWTGWRKLRFSLTALIFLGFSVILMLWGALEPWSA